MIKKRIEIIPSVLSMDLACIKESLKMIPNSVNMLHLDVMDGHYVNNITFGPVFLRSMRRATRKKIDAHLMITNPDKYASDFMDCGADLISFHPETSSKPLKLIQQIKKRGVKAGLALNPDIPVKSILKYLPHVDYVLLMSVFPGFAGQEFIESVLEKIDYLKRERGRMKFAIEIDGGINNLTGRRSIERGAEWIVSGSYLFRGGSVQKNIERILYDA
jgi:ribulose-phosphate 3-epimerase